MIKQAMVSQRPLKPFRPTYVWILMAVSLTAVLGLYGVAEEGQSRLVQASREVEIATRRQQALSMALQLLTQAETNERGFLISADSGYLEPYERAEAAIPAALDELQAAFASGDTAFRAKADRVRLMAGERLGEMKAALALYNAKGPDAAFDLLRTDFGKQAMDETTAIIWELQQHEADEIAAASRAWPVDLRVTRWLTAGGALLNILLVLLAALLVVRSMRRREQYARHLADRGAELAREVTQQTEQLSALSTHLQRVSEEEKSSLARELHDELGGLLVAARMDLSWLEERLPSVTPEVQERFERVHEALKTGVDIKRRVVENLRPTLLDNLGLFPALRWLFDDYCGRAALQCTQRYPEVEPRLNSEASIALFRIAQEALVNVIKHAHATKVEVSVDVETDVLALRIADDGVGIPVDRLQTIGSHGLGAMRHRAMALGGTWRIVGGPERGTRIDVYLPLAHITTSAPEAG